MKIAGIILAAGKGTRLKIKGKNKVALPFLSKPMVIYGVELLAKITSVQIVVVGAFAQSVKEVLHDHKVIYAYQKKRLGTAHAVKIALEELHKRNLSPDHILVGYGDHTMFYKKETIIELIELHKSEKAEMSLLTTICEDPNQLAWGRIIRSPDGLIKAIVEQKDANDKTRTVREVNPGFYCFNFDFLERNIPKIKKSVVSNEYYLTDLIAIANQQGQKVVGLNIPFSGVGIGINRYSELEESQRLYLSSKEKI